MKDWRDEMGKQAVTYWAESLWDTATFFSKEEGKQRMDL